MINRIQNRTALGILREVKRLWNDELIPHLRRSEIAAGRGIRIQKLAAGTMISSTSSTSSAAAAAAGGLNSNFEVQFDYEKKKLTVGAGFINCNGFCKKFDCAEITPQNGILCLSAEKDGTNWKHGVKFADFDEYNFPIAEIKVEDTDVQIKQYPVAVAVFIISKVCPLTRASAK
jgi:hypothetical protein